MRKAILLCVVAGLGIPASAQTIRYNLSPYDVFIDGTEYKVVGVTPLSGTLAPTGERGVLYQLEDGRYALPRAYPLMPGDDALWAGMSQAQQEHALRYLESGSTIASSLSRD